MIILLMSSPAYYVHLPDECQGSTCCSSYFPITRSSSPASDVGQQFMSGPWFLVAPVYQPISKSGGKRDGIYLPAGADWIDYWNSATIVGGGVVVNGYDAPLDKLPMFVRAGAIVPMWPESIKSYGAAEPKPDPLTIEVWPAGNSSFELYEDDGRTRQALSAGGSPSSRAPTGPASTQKFAKTKISCFAGSSALRTGGRVQIAIGPSEGDFDGKLAERGYDIRVHAPKEPKAVHISGTAGPGYSTYPLSKTGSWAELDHKPSGWFFEPDAVSQTKWGGLVAIKTPKKSTGEGFDVVLEGEPPRQHIALVEDCANDGASFDFDPLSKQIVARGTSSAEMEVVNVAANRGSFLSSSQQCLTVGEDKDVASNTPALELQPCQTKPSQQWVFLPSGQMALTSDGGNCIDYDATDRRAEMYPCHDGGAVGNQKWLFDKQSGRISSGVDARCFGLTWSSGRSADALSSKKVVALEQKILSSAQEVAAQPTTIVYI